MVISIPTSIAYNETKDEPSVATSIDDDDLFLEGGSDPTNDVEDDKSVASVRTSGSISYCGRTYNTGDFTTGNQVLVESMGGMDAIDNESVASAPAVSIGQMLGDMRESLSTKFQRGTEASNNRRDHLTRSMSAKVAFRVPPRSASGSTTRVDRRQLMARSASEKVDRRQLLARSFSEKSVRSSPDSVMGKLERTFSKKDLLPFGLCQKGNKQVVPEHLQSVFSRISVDDNDIRGLVNNDKEFQRFKQTLKRNGAVTNGKMGQLLPLYVGNRRNVIHSQTTPCA